MIGEWSRKISNQICENQNEKEIIQYGLNQLFWILLNFLQLQYQVFCGTNFVLVSWYFWKYIFCARMRAVIMLIQK